MPNHKSCEKRVKTSDKQRLRNRGTATFLRAQIRELRAMTDKTAATARLKEVTALIDRAAGKKVIHKSTASRNKSRLARFVATLQ